MAELIELESFDLTTYMNLLKPTIDRLKKRRKLHTPKLDEIKEMLPPPVFSADVFLLRKGADENEPIPLSQLSTGEKQFLHVMSTIIYHVDNLRSVKSPNRMRYRKVNIMLDEAEMCFHPELQCKFIKKIMDYIAGTRHNTYMTFNIIIVTHSPFILSDIPQCNILYLNEGIPDIQDKINPFAANVNDILHQSFFMRDGFIGEFAKKKISDFVKLTDKEIQTQADARELESMRQYVPSIVGDQLMREILIDLINEKSIHNR